MPVQIFELDIPEQMGRLMDGYTERMKMDGRRYAPKDTWNDRKTTRNTDTHRSNSTEVQSFD